MHAKPNPRHTLSSSTRPTLTLSLPLIPSLQFFTFDVIGKVGFGYDFGAIDNETHPYLKQIQLSGELSDARNKLDYYQLILSQRSFLKQWVASNQPNIKFVEEIVNKRKAELSEGVRADQKDVLSLMLTASDPQYVFF